MDGVIVETCTRPSNYTMIFGSWAGNPIGFAVVGALFGCWVMRERRRVGA